MSDFLTRRYRIRFAALLAGTAALMAVTLVTSAKAQELPDAPPYEESLMRLSEVLGALHFLRPLCDHADIPSWRDQMATFLDAETVDENRRRRFIERFNQGHRGFSSVYRTCTASARLAMEQYVSEGQTLIRDVTSRYGR
ncbi:TIGR02301 family protein [Roseibium sp.]|uniref:TIGR02301 family protein n=1 Tax=Roseibium sp. TaxID=1936156 RepID=UPI003A97DC9B